MNLEKEYKLNKRVVINFKVHQPRRLKKFQFFDIGSHAEYFDDQLNERVITEAAHHCYLPANKVLLEIISRQPSTRLCFSISGVALDQFERYTPEVIESFKSLAETGKVEFLAETGYHSHESLMSKEELQAQISKHVERIRLHFGVHTSVLRGSERMYNTQLENILSELGFIGLLSDGRCTLDEQSPYLTYAHTREDSLPILLSNYKLSQDIIFHLKKRMADLNVNDYLRSLFNGPNDNPFIVLELDYENFSTHDDALRNTLDSLDDFIVGITNERDIKMQTPTELFRSVAPSQSSSGANFKEGRLLDNEMQLKAFQTVQELEILVKETGRSEIVDIWRKLYASDHFYFMSTRETPDRTYPGYPSPYRSPYEAFRNYMNIVSDFKLFLKETAAQPAPEEQARSLEYERQHKSPPVWARNYQAYYKHPSYPTRQI